jgi:hypothetical protein
VAGSGLVNRYIATQVAKPPQAALKGQCWEKLSEISLQWSRSSLQEVFLQEDHLRPFFPFLPRLLHFLVRERPVVL